MSAVEATRMIGQVIGSYRVVSLLGEGGMGSVWLAEHTLLGRHVAIKFLHADVSQNPSIVERFFAEARAATRIADPGIVVVYDFGWHTDKSAYIVMEHLGGESVASRLRAGRFAPPDAVRVVQQAAMAMAVAHARGIIHRDLKPDNLFLVPDPAMPAGERVKILDFGIAKLVGDEHGAPTSTRTGSIMGTPTYMSPEQCRGAGDIDHRTDIYALGCVLYHLLCGHAPFPESTTAGELIASHLREPPRPPSAYAPGIPAAIDAIVMRCMAKSASDRHATMTELVRALAAATGAGEPIMTIAPLRATPRPGGAPTPTPRPAPTPAPAPTFASAAGESFPAPSRRSRALVLVLGAAMLATIATVAILLATSSPSDSVPSSGAPLAPAAAVATSAPDAGVSSDAAAVAPVEPAPPDAGPPPAEAAPKPKRRPRPRPTAVSCADDPYACP